MRIADAFCRIIDAVNDRVGKTVAWLFIPFTLLVFADVITRYALRKPWFYIDINIQLMCALALLGGGYLFVHGGHIGVDVLVTRLSPKYRAILDIILFPIFAGSIGALFWKTGESAWDSWRVLERYQSALGLPIYPLKILVALGVLLVLLQGVAKLIRDLKIAFSPRSGDRP